ncbi:MAG: protein kinase, partial [Spirochaetota bacterium]
MPEEISFVVNTMMLHVSREGFVDYCNNAFIKFVGIPKEQVIGAAFESIVRLPGGEIFKNVELPGPKEKKQFSGTNSAGRTFEIKAVGVGGGADITMTEKTELEQLRAYVGRYILKGMDDLTDDEKSTFAIPERRFMSVSFTDLRGFTAMSEKMRPEEVRETINAYLEAVMKAVEDNNGTIDKIVGDEVMALFGAPRHYKDHALRAVKTALDQKMNLRKLQEEYRRQGKVMPECGIGVNTGEMVVGNIGSETRMNYTVLGSSVNIAARLCGAAQSGQVICTPATLKEILENLPEGWESKKENPQPQPFPLKEGEGSAPPFPLQRGKGAGGLGVPLHGKTEGIFELPEELRGVVVSVGPKDNPLYKFTYLYSIKVKGVDEPLPVIEVSGIEDEKALAFTAGDLSKTILSDATDTGEKEKVFGRYRLFGLLGKGGMAQVYRARDNFGNDVAVKMLLAGEGATPEQLLRFMREAEVMKMLDHRNLCRVMDVGQYEGISYIAMELLPGVTLGDLMSASGVSTKDNTINELVSIAEAGVAAKRHSPPPPPPAPPPLSQGSERGGGVSVKAVHGLSESHALALFDGVLAGVACAHEKGIIHRDLKPGNVMIKRNGDPVVMDFGLARFEQSEGDLTVTQQVVGTIDFMAPEQATLSKKADERSDIFSLGAILYYMLTGQKWFVSSGNLLSDVEAIRDKNVIAPHTWNGRISKDLETIVLKALEKEPERRYQDVNEFRADIARYRANEPIHARPPSIMYVLSKKVQKHRKIVIPSAAAVLLAFISLFFFYGERLKEAVTWRLIYTDDFSYPTSQLSNNWTAYFLSDYSTTEVIPFGDTTHWHIISNSIVGSNKIRFDNLTFRHLFHGDMRVEWDVRGLFRNNDYNAYIAGRTRRDAYMFHVGGWGFANIITMTKGKNIDKIAYAYLPAKLVTNRTYRFRMEKEGEHIRFFVDGKKCIDIVDYDMLTGDEHRQFGFENNNMNILAIDNVRVYDQPPARKISPMAVANSLYALGDYSNALTRYTELIDVYPREPFIANALFKAARICIRLGDAKKADKYFEDIVKQGRSKVLVPYAQIERAKICLDVDDTTGADALFKKLAEQYSSDKTVAQTALFSLDAYWNRKLTAITGIGDVLYGEQLRISGGTNELLSLITAGRESMHRWARVFGFSLTNSSFLQYSASKLSALGRYDLVISQYPEIEVSYLASQIRMGMYDEVLTNSFGNRYYMSVAARNLGRFDEVLSNFTDQPHSCAGALIDSGRFEE